MDTKEGLDCGAPRVMMECQVYQVCPVRLDPQDPQPSQEAWDLRWPEALMGSTDLRP